MDNRARPARHPVLTVATLLAALFAYSAMESMIAPVLPLLRDELQATPGQVGWIFTALLLAGAVATPVVGRLGDLYDKRRVAAWLLAVVIAGAVLTATTQHIGVFLLGQALQGSGLGLMPLAAGLIGEMLPRERISTANGLLIVAITASTAVGLVAAGPVAGALGLRYIYWLPMALLGICLAALLWLRGPGGRTAPAAIRFDWAGAVLLAIGLVALLLAIDFDPVRGWGTRGDWLWSAIAAVSLGAWVVFQRRHASPLVDIGLISSRPIAATCIVAFAVGFGSVGSYVLVSLMVQSDPAGGIGLGASATEAGWYLLPFGLMGIWVAPLTAPLERAITPRGVMMLGTSLVALGAALPALLHDWPWQVYLATCCLGAGIALALNEAINVVVRSAGAERAAGVSGVVFVVRGIGAAAGTQAGASLLGRTADPATGWATSAGFVSAFVLTAAVAAVALLASTQIPGGTRHASVPYGRQEFGK